jgi:hypothetical protein
MPFSAKRVTLLAGLVPNRPRNVCWVALYAAARELDTRAAMLRRAHGRRWLDATRHVRGKADVSGRRERLQARLLRIGQR